jgi:hypothetical protein
MPSVEAIYNESVKRLPLEERIRLANIILREANEPVAPTGDKRSALDLLQSLPSNGHSRTSIEIDKYLNTERGSWED